jgi:prophage regulatory protein
MAATTNVLSFSSALQVSTLIRPETGCLRQSQVLVFVPVSKSTLWWRI